MATAMEPYAGGGMTPTQRFLFDTNGFLVIPDCVPDHQLADARAALEEGCDFVYTADPRLGILAFNPKAWPVIMELTRGQPMIRLGSGINNAPYSGEGPAGGGPLCAPLLPPTPHAPPTHH